MIHAKSTAHIANDLIRKLNDATARILASERFGTDHAWTTAKGENALVLGLFDGINLALGHDWEEYFASENVHTAGALQAFCAAVEKFRPSWQRPIK